MSTSDLILRKRDGEELSTDEIVALVDGFMSGEVPDYQMAAFLMAVYFAGLDEREVDALTRRLIDSGARLDLSDVDGVKVGKYSTGGVGDKTALIAGPLAAAAGVVVPMMPGRSRDYLGGTLDKLEAIPGFRTDLSVDEFKAQLKTHKLAFMNQPEEIGRAHV